MTSITSPSGRHRPPVVASATVTASVLASLVLLALSGCAAGTGSQTPGDDAAAGTVAASFARALADADGSAACDLLAATTRTTLEADSGADCADAITALELPDPGSIRSSEAYGRGAQANFEQDIEFLTLENGQWRVTAAGCVERPDRPYQCDLKGD
jgi:hypothetical protein